jgi:heptosyltransferase I
LSAIGDACHALAVIRTLQQNWPGARITWIIGKTEASLLADISDVEFIIFDKSDGLRAYADLRRKLATRRFDVALCMHASMRANILCRMIPAPLRVGFDAERARDFQRLFTNRRIAAVAGQHALDAMMGFATAIGARQYGLRWDIPIDESDRQFAGQYVHSGSPLLVVSPCSSQRSRNFRNWSIDNYAAVIAYAQQTYNCRVILTGGSTPLERDYGHALAGRSHGRLDNLIGATTLKQLLALLDAAAIVLCPDSGPAHMATAVGTPVIGLYATSNPNRTGPYLSRQYTVDRYGDAVERFLGKRVSDVRWGQRVRHADAMALITVDDVTAKLDNFFAS